MSRFSEQLLDHARNPRNGGAMESPDAIGKADLGGRAPYVTIFLRTNADNVIDIRFQAFGCGVTIAACSALTELAKGKSCEVCRAIQPDEIQSRLNGIPADKSFCADLAISALRSALDDLD